MKKSSNTNHPQCQCRNTTYQTQKHIASTKCKRFKRNCGKLRTQREKMKNEGRGLTQRKADRVNPRVTLTTTMHSCPSPGYKESHHTHTRSVLFTHCLPLGPSLDHQRFVKIQQDPITRNILMIKESPHS